MRTSMRWMAVPLFLFSAGLTSGCLYTNIHTPRAYRSATPADVKADASDERVSGRACYRSALFLVAWGDGGYAAAVRDAMKEWPEAVLYDVKADIEAKSYLMGIYTRVCTVVSGRAGAP
ncbi:MAG: TRL domain-containing protein [Elusimicrobiota bacterium]